MGKKPVFAMFGLVWAGIALTGCGESCRNCRNKYNASPTFSTKTTKMDSIDSTPTIVGDSKPATSNVNAGRVSGAANTPSSANTIPASGSAGFSSSGIEPAGGSGVPMPPVNPTPMNAPTKQSSLRPAEERSPLAPTTPVSTSNAARRLDDGLNTMTSRPTPTGEPRKMEIPPRPVTPPSSSLPPAPMPSSASLPAIGSSGSDLPPPPLTPPMPDTSLPGSGPLPVPPPGN